MLQEIQGEVKMKNEHMDDRCCRDCIKYSCNYVITNEKKGHSCPCGCHILGSNKEDKK